MLWSREYKQQKSLPSPKEVEIMAGMGTRRSSKLKNCRWFRMTCLSWSNRNRKAKLPWNGCNTSNACLLTSQKIRNEVYHINIPWRKIRILCHLVVDVVQHCPNEMQEQWSWQIAAVAIEAESQWRDAKIFHLGLFPLMLWSRCFIMAFRFAWFRMNRAECTFCDAFWICVMNPNIQRSLAVDPQLTSSGATMGNQSTAE